MGEAAAEYSDFTIVTSDNPRSEDPMSIIKMVEAGMKGKKYQVVLDRAEAIESAVPISNLLKKRLILMTELSLAEFSVKHG